MCFKCAVHRILLSHRARKRRARKTQLETVTFVVQKGLVIGIEPKGTMQGWPDHLLWMFHRRLFFCDRRGRLPSSATTHSLAFPFVSKDIWAYLFSPGGEEENVAANPELSFFSSSQKRGQRSALLIVNAYCRWASSAHVH